MAKILIIKPKRMGKLLSTSKKLMYGEIPRRVKIDGEVWTWKDENWGKTLRETEVVYRNKGYRTKIAEIKGQKQLYIRKSKV